MKTKISIQIFVVIENNRPGKTFFSKDEAEAYYYEKYQMRLTDAWIETTHLETEINFSLDNMNLKITKQ